MLIKWQIFNWSGSRFEGLKQGPKNALHDIGEYRSDLHAGFAASKLFAFQLAQHTVVLDS